MPAGAPVVAVVGPTAAGKSDLAVALARRLGGEVVNADAMQLYRGMDIGTAKLPGFERLGVPHHQLDVLEVTERASVAAYQRAARRELAAVAARGRRPLLVGGSGLYVAAVLTDLEFPGTDPAVRARLEAELAELGPLALHRRLAERDPAAAAALLPTNGRRVVRALEVLEITGRPFAARLPRPAGDAQRSGDAQRAGGAQRAGDDPAAGGPPTSRAAVPATVIGLDLPRDVLDTRIEARVAAMFDAGLVEETAVLVGRGLRTGPTASRAVGYAQVLDLLDGRFDEDGARTATATATRRLARRQLSWFRRDPATMWLSADAPDLLDRALAAIEAGPA